MTNEVISKEVRFSAYFRPLGDIHRITKAATKQAASPYTDVPQ